MSSNLQLDVRYLSRWWRHLVNAYEYAWCLLQVKLCDPCLSALKWFVYHARRYTSARLCLFYLFAVSIDLHSVEMKLQTRWIVLCCVEIPSLCVRWRTGTCSLHRISWRSAHVTCSQRTSSRRLTRERRYAERHICHYVIECLEDIPRLT